MPYGFYDDKSKYPVEQMAADITNSITPELIGAVPVTRQINGKLLNANVVLTAADVGAAAASRTINGKPLSNNVTLTAADVGAVPVTRTVCGKPLDANVSLFPSDVHIVYSSTAPVNPLLGTIWLQPAQ